MMDVNDDVFQKDTKYFNMVIKPMLTPGHEGELCEWMKEMGLIRQVWRCNNKECAGPRESVGGYMVWSKARVVDKYTWICRTCSKRLPIRSESFFAPFKCDLKKVFQVILCWCKRVSFEVTAKYLDLKLPVVTRIYDGCSEIASQHVKAHSDEWKLGGEGVVVVVDVYPDGYMTSTPRTISVGKRRSTNKKRILCIAEISHIPARIWVKILDEVRSKPKDSPGTPNSSAVKEALDQITQHVCPGSTLVANDRASVCSFEAVKTLKEYPIVYSVERLIELNLPGTRVLQDNLETIWQSVVEVCDESQEWQMKIGSILLDEFMWRQLIAQTSSCSSLESLLHQIAEQYSEKWKQKRNSPG